MKTSRIARETAKATAAVDSPTNFARRQTRALTASLQAFAANDPFHPNQGIPLKQEPASITPSTLSPERDFEDSFLGTSGPRKRRRTGIATSTTTLSTASTSTSTRASPRKKELDGEVATSSKARKARRQPAKKVTADDGEVKFEPPANWEEIYQTVQKMREERNAPVDTMGCETLADEHLSARDKRFQTLIALMLSSQTKDTTNAIAMKRLQTELPSPGLTLENILVVDPVKLNELIYVVGFHNNKTRYIKAAAEILRDEFKGDIPDTIEGLMSLPGVGPKMAYLCMSAAWGRTEGIGVDVHVHRITNLWGWHKTKGPEETRSMLESWLPKDKWHEINHLLVGFGQTICAPLGRKCGRCLLSAKGLCPSAVVEKKSTVRRVEKRSVKYEEAVDKSEGIVVKQEELIEADKDSPG